MKQSIWMQEFSFKNNAVMYRMIQCVLYLMRTNQCDMNSGTHLETGSNIALILMKDETSQVKKGIFSYQ